MSSINASAFKIFRFFKVNMTGSKVRRKSMYGYVVMENSNHTSQKENRIERSTYREYKELNWMTPADTIAHGRSEHIQEAWIEQEVDRETFPKSSYTSLIEGTRGRPETCVMFLF